MTYEIKRGEIWHRDDFGMLCTWRCLRRCVEVGVDRGEFSHVFMSRHINLEIFIGVDNYEPYSGMAFDRAADFAIACQRYERFGSIAKLVKASSAEAAETFASVGKANHLYGAQWDFVYIDADHGYESVLTDIELWWPLLSNKGILAGHDWHVNSGDHTGVRRAVETFAKANGLPIYFTYVDDPQSWYIYKSGAPGQDFERRPDL